MDTKLDFKIETKYEVIGQGPMIDKPCQIGEWWVIPAKEYKGKIPPEIKQKLWDFLKQKHDFEIVGILVADDIMAVTTRPEKKVEVPPRIGEINNPGPSIGEILRITGQVFLWMLGLVLAVAFDPMLIAVLADGRWICVGSWYE